MSKKLNAPKYIHFQVLKLSGLSIFLHFQFLTLAGSDTFVHTAALSVSSLIELHILTKVCLPRSLQVQCCSFLIRVHLARSYSIRISTASSEKATKPGFFYELCDSLWGLHPGRVLPVPVCLREEEERRGRRTRLLRDVRLPVPGQLAGRDDGRLHLELVVHPDRLVLTLPRTEPLHGSVGPRQEN